MERYCTKGESAFLGVVLQTTLPWWQMRWLMPFQLSQLLTERPDGQDCPPGQMARWPSKREKRRKPSKSLVYVYIYIVYVDVYIYVIESKGTGPNIKAISSSKNGRARMTLATKPSIQQSSPSCSLKSLFNQSL